jgi:regulator of protease activity HflC (stomatin/prohibitin superfamily)
VISLLGFLGFLAGIGLAVVNASQGRSVRGGVMIAIFGLVIGLLSSIISQGIVIVQPQERAVVFNVLEGELQEPPLGPGTHIVVPIVQEFTVYPVRQQEYTMSDVSTEGRQTGQDAVVARTKDGQEVRIDITVIYNLDPDRVNLVHERWQSTYETGFVRPTVRSLVREVVAGYEAAEIYGQAAITLSGEPDPNAELRGRAELEGEITDRIVAAFDAEGIILTQSLVRAINFREEFANAIERKEIERQELERARTEAERVETQARGQANAAIEAARGEAQAIVLRAQAEAEALRLVSEQIAANPSLIQFQYVQNLSDNVSLMLVPSNSPFLFDFNSLASPDAGFTAPEVPEVTIPEVTDDTTDSGS